MVSCQVLVERNIRDHGGGHPVRTDLEVDLLLSSLVEGEEHHESLVHASRGCSHCHSTPWLTPWGWLISSFLLHPLCFSAQVIFRALSPPYSAEDPYSAEAQAQLKITNLRVRLLERQGCPCLAASPAPQPPPSLHYAIYDFIVKGSCFCNGHADHCMPVTGFKPVKAAGVFHVVCTCTQQRLRCSKAEF